MRRSLYALAFAAGLVVPAAVHARDLSYLKTKPYDQLTAAEITAAKEAAKELKVPNLVACADPGNMPLSNEKLEGFQNKIAAVVAKHLGNSITFFWRPYLERGLTRDTFDNNECQVLIDMPADYASILTTIPIYRSTYVLATRKDRNLAFETLEDPRLQTLKVGVFQHSGVREALANRGIKDVDVHIISADADLRPEAQPWRQVQRVVDGELDVAAVWGPFAGWLEKKGAPLNVQPINNMDDEIPLEFSLAWGVQNTDVVLKLRIDMALDDAKDEIEAILRDYGVPLVRCSTCVVEGDIPSHGAILNARSKSYEERFLKAADKAELTDKASKDQIVTRERLEAWLAEGRSVDEELMNAITGGDLERVTFLIEKKADVNKADGLGHRPLHAAASSRRSHLLEPLIKAGAKVDERDSDGMTAMLHAVNANHVPSIEILARSGANLELGTERGYTPLEMALSDGKTFAAKALIDAGAKVDVANGPEGMTPLMVVATQLQPKQRLNQLSKGPTPLVIAEELIRRKANVNAATSEGITALMVAAGFNNAPMIGLLVRNGADVNARSKAGKSALDIAKEIQNEAAVGALKFLGEQAGTAPAAEPAATK